MDRGEILRLLEKEEGNKLEFKEIFNDSVLKTISAFANTYGGLIIVGGTIEFSSDISRNHFPHFKIL